MPFENDIGLGPCVLQEILPPPASKVKHSKIQQNLLVKLELVKSEAARANVYRPTSL